MKDKRLGRKATNEQKKIWPDTTISGHVYTHPTITVGLPDGYFAVVDQFIAPNKRDAIILELRAIIESEGAHDTKRSAAKGRKTADDTRWGGDADDPAVSSDLAGRGEFDTSGE
jgi:hypothetical protein